MAESANRPLSGPSDTAEMKPEELAADAELTRRRLDRTITQLERKLSPQNLAQKGIAAVRERTLRLGHSAEEKAQEVRRGTASWTREHPTQALALAFVAGLTLGYSR